MASITTLFSFDGTHGAFPLAGLIADAAGDLFGTTQAGGGANNDGTVFEIVKTASGYASTPTVLFSFDGTHGASPEAGLIADAAGDLFGTTAAGGANGRGTVFEIVKTGSGYASTPTVLFSSIVTAPPPKPASSPMPPETCSGRRPPVARRAAAPYSRS